MRMDRSEGENGLYTLGLAMLTLCAFLTLMSGLLSEKFGRKERRVNSLHLAGPAITSSSPDVLSKV